MDDKLTAILKRCQFDFEAFCRVALRIRVADGPMWRFVPFVLNSEQVDVYGKIAEMEATGRSARLVVLKSRKLGISTLVQAIAYHRATYNAGYKAQTIAHVKEATDEIAGICRTYADYIPEPLQGTFGATPVNGGLLWKNGSTLRVMTQGGRDQGRGSSPSLMHLSEVALWEMGRARSSGSDPLSSMLGSAEEAGTLVVMESTAKGARGVFFRQWNMAQRANAKYKPVFLPWHTSMRHQPPMNPEERAAYEALLDGEGASAYQKLGITGEWFDRAVKFKLTPSQVTWALGKIEELGGKLEKFDEEFPLSPDHAFLSSGRPVFRREHVEAVRVEDSPIHTAGLLNVNASSIKDTSNAPGDSWLFWREPEPGQWRYAIGVDIASGGGGDMDSSCIQVFDRARREQVAEFISNEIPPDQLGFQVLAVWRLYHGLVCPEANNHGPMVVRALLDTNVPMVRRAQLNNASSTSWMQEWGYWTSKATRTPLLEAMAADVRAGLVVMKSARLQDEMREFAYDANGIMDHGSDGHDDAIVGFALALEAHRQSSPVEAPKDAPASVPSWRLALDRRKKARRVSKWAV